MRDTSKKTPKDATEFEREQLRFFLTKSDAAATLAEVNPSLAWLPMLAELKLIDAETQLAPWIQNNFAEADAVREVAANIHFFGPDTADILEFRLNQTEGLPPLLIMCWRLIIRHMRTAKRGALRYEWFDIVPRINRGEQSPELLERIAHVLRPKLQVGKRLSWHDEEGRREPERPTDLISIEYEIEYGVTEEEVLSAWPEDAPADVDDMSGPCPGCEPFGTDELVRDAALWAGSGTGTGLLIFNDSQGFQFGNLGWNNPELSLPVGWGISDSLQGGGFADGGYTQIVGAFAGHPVYANVNSVRLAPNSISSFAANISDTSFHSIFAPGWNAAIFAASEVVQNANVVDVGGFNAAFGFGFFQAAQGPDGEAITLIRECEVEMDIDIDIKPQSCPNPLNTKKRGVLPVAILGTAGFDVTQVDLATVQLEGVAPLRSALEDVATPFGGAIQDPPDAVDCTAAGPDGFLDLTLKFDAQAIVATLGAVTDGEVRVLQLTGQLLDGTAITGADVVRILVK